MKDTERLPDGLEDQNVMVSKQNKIRPWQIAVVEEKDLKRDNNFFRLKHNYLSFTCVV